MVSGEAPRASGCRTPPVPARVAQSAVPISVTGVHPLLPALPEARTADRRSVRRHQHVDERLQHRADHIGIDVRALQLLARPAGRVDSGRDGHRVPPQGFVWKLLFEVDTMTVASGGPLQAHPLLTPPLGTQLSA